MNSNARHTSSVGLFLLSLILTFLGIGVTYGPMVLSLLFYSSALVVGCIAAARASTGGAARTAVSCGFVVVAVVTPWILPILKGESAGYALVVGIYGPAISLLALSWAYLTARSSKPWPYIAAVVLAVVLVAAPHKLMVHVAHLLWETPLFGYIWAALVIAFGVAFFLLIVVLNRGTENRHPAEQTKVMMPDEEN